MIKSLFIPLFLFSFSAYANLNCHTVSLKEIQENQKALGYDDNQLTHWKNVEKPKAVTIVSHGLNLRPDKMHDITDLYKELHVDVLQVTLAGHGNDFAEYTEVNHETWYENINAAYCLAQRWSKDQGIPLIFTGYSLSGVYGVDLILNNPHVKFDKLVLLSPAIKLTGLGKMAKLFLWTNLNLPSRARKTHRAHSKTPMAAYRALFQSVKEVAEAESYEALNISALVFIDKKDELVSFRKLNKFTTKNQLKHWKIHPVAMAGEVTKISARHHNIFDKTVTGAAVWEEMSSQIRQHIFP